MEVVTKVFKQVSWQLAGKFISSVSTLLVLGIVTRSYGETGTGVFTLALTYLAFFFLATDLGLNAYILPKLDLDPDQANKLFNFRLIWAVLLVVLANLIAVFLPFHSSEFVSSVFFGSITILFFGIFNSTNLIFQKNLRYDLSIIASSLGALTVLTVVAYLSQLKVAVSYLALGPVLGWFVNSLVALYLSKNLLNFKLQKISAGFPIETLKVAWPISLTLLLNTVYFRVDTFILTSSHSFADSGNYNLAYSVFQAILVLPTFIMNSFYPLMISKLSENKSAFIKQAKRVGITLFGLSLVASSCGYFFASFVIKILSGQGFLGSVQSLQILSLGFPAYFISSLLMWVMISLKKYKAMSLVYFIGLMINIILNLIFIPKYSYLASSWITGISEYLILSMLIIMLYKDFKQN